MLSALKNLPTTWGLRLGMPGGRLFAIKNSEKPPHHMGIKTINTLLTDPKFKSSEKPPHHMGIKTVSHSQTLSYLLTLKNLPTTWGLRQTAF